MKNFEEINRTFTVKTNLISLNRSGMGPDGMSRKGRYSLDPILSRLCVVSLIWMNEGQEESAKSAKPNFALNGVGDGSLWVAEYLTNNERISN